MRHKGILSLTVTWLILGMIPTAASRGRAAPLPATLQAVSVSAPASGHELHLRIDGGYSFRTVQATEDTVFVDLKGVRAGGVAKSGQWSGGLLTGYRLLQYTDSGHQPVLRVQVEMKHPEPFKVQQDRAGLHLLFGKNPAATLTAAAAPAAPAAAPMAITSKTVPAVSSSSKGPAEVSGVSVQAGPEGETFVDISTTRTTAYRVLQLKNPARLVVDLESARNAAHRRSYAAQSSVLKGVRVGQFSEKDPAVVRVVADLVGDPAFDVHAQPGGVRIELKSRLQATKPALPKPTAATLPAVPAEEKPVQAAVTAPSSAAPAQPAGRPVAALQTEVVAQKVAGTQPEAATPTQVDYRNALPAAAGSKEVTAAPRPEPPAQVPEALQASKAARTLATSSVFEGTLQGQAPAGAAEEQPKYTGEPVSLNLKDVDLKDFFRLIHEISGLNIIIDPNVTGAVTLVLDAVPWDQALEIVLKNNRLDKKLEGNVLRIARVDTLTAEQEATAKLAAAREAAAPLVTVFRPVNYAKAGTIATMLKSWVGGGALTSRGNILVDDRTNTLIISDITTQIPNIESIIAKLDKKAKQVSIEARVVLASASFTRALGVQLAGTRVAPFRGGTHVTSAGTGPGAPVATDGTLPGGINTAVGAAGGALIAVHTAGSRAMIDAVISAAETRSQAKTISRPSIVTQNNVPGNIVQGTQIPIQTIINNTPTVQLVAAALTLTVTPQVTEDGNIFLVINVTNSAPGQIFANGNPGIDTQSATTQVLVPDGGTVVFGGVTVTGRKKLSSSVPLLGSIPILGHLFKTTSVADNDAELLFFVSPKVLPG